MEQQQQTKTNYDTKYWTIGTNKKQLQYQKVNSNNKQKPTLILSIKQQEQRKVKYNTKHWTATINKSPL